MTNNTNIPCRWNRSKIESKKIEAGKIDIPNVHIFTGPLSWFGAGTSIKSGGVELV